MNNLLKTDSFIDYKSIYNPGNFDVDYFDGYRKQLSNGRQYNTETDFYLEKQHIYSVLYNAYELCKKIMGKDAC